jgi:hypothetical protein
MVLKKETLLKLWEERWDGGGPVSAAMTRRTWELETQRRTDVASSRAVVTVSIRCQEGVIERTVKEHTF